MLKKASFQTTFLFTLTFIFLACSSQKELRNLPPANQLQAAQPSSAPYIIRPGDQLDIKFFYNPELNESVTVRPDGKISLQLVDEVQAAGLEPAELDARLTEAYSQELKKPMVTVSGRLRASAFTWAGKSTSSAIWSCPPA